MAPAAAAPMGTPAAAPATGRASGNRYRMAQRLASIGDDYFIQNEAGQRVFKVDGKALRVRSTLKFEDMRGNELAHIQERMLRVRDTMNVEGPNGEVLASVRKAMITPLRDRYVVKIGNGPDLNIQGNIVDHEFRISDGNQVIAEASKRWFRVRDTYGIEIAPGQQDIVILAAIVCVDQMSNPAR
jgi:uncharacterized protein YxjI